MFFAQLYAVFIGNSTPLSVKINEVAKYSNEMFQKRYFRGDFQNADTII